MIRQWWQQVWRRPTVVGLLILASSTLFFLSSTRAQTPTDYVLHGTGPDNNPPTLFLNTTAPTATAAKFRDSAGVNFSGGNLWKDIGTWPAASPLTTGTLTALSDLHVWLGLKNSDDQGTQFDVRADILKNSTVIATGLTRCIAGIVRNAANAKAITVAFGSAPSTPFNGTTDTLAVKISTRIGTNPDDTKCPGHNNAVGLRLYFDATSRNARFDATIATQQTPTIANFSPTQGVVGTAVTITGTNFDPVPATNTVTFNGVTATVTAAAATTITTSVPAGATTGPMTVTTAAGTATSATNFTVLAPPTVTNITPTSGRAGATVTVTGTNFVSVSAVTFNGAPATNVTVQNATTLTAVVSATATTGPLAVTTPGGTATSTGQFVVIPTQDMQLSVLPATVTIPPSGQASFAIVLTGSGGFTNVATLAVTGLPSGMTATFKAATLTAGQSTLLTLTTNSTISAGNVPLTVTATGLVNGVSTTRSAPVTVQVQAAGVTSLTGQVLDEEDHPVKNAAITLGALLVSTDDGGNFLLLNPPVGADQLLLIDGGPASTPTQNFPIIPYKVTIVAGQDNQLGFIPTLHVQKTTGLVDIANSAVQRLVTDPAIPGFQMIIPAGVTITGWDGQPNTQISIRQVPIDGNPLPPPPADRVVRAVYMDYFGKPGGGTPSAPIPVTLPNDLDLPPGTQAELWYYDEAPDGSRPNQWAQYGTGTVSADGSRVVPDLDPSTGNPFGQPRFCCGAIFLALLRAQQAVIDLQRSGDPTAAGGDKGGEPVDLGTGIFTLEKTDLLLPGRLPVLFTRHYKTQGAPAGPFGPGTSHSYQVLLLIESNLRMLVFPTGTRIAFPQQTDGTFRNGTDPAYRGAVLTGSTLRFKDGAVWTFGVGSGTTLFLTGQTDRTGNQLTLTRTGAAFNVTAITASDGRQLVLTYDGGNRITSLSDPAGRSVTYGYDGNGRLVSIVDPAGGITRYTYDSQGRMLTLTDAKDITFLTNEYDAAGRVSKQTQADGGQWLFAYTLSSGIITQSTVVDPRGTQQITRFNGRGYGLERTDGQGQATQSRRDPATNQVTASTDSLGRITTFEYDAQGNVTRITDHASHITAFEYEPTFNRVKKITDALNQVTEFTYDPANGNLLTVKDPLNHVTSISYNQFGQPISVQGPIANEPPTTFAYDANGNLITTTDPLGNQTQRAYDVVSRLTSLTDPRQLQAQFRYDGLNRVTEIADARQGITRFSYDNNGNLLSVQDAKAQPTTYTYDAMDRLFTRKDALNRQESYQYDPAGNLAQFTDRKTQPATFTYDALNRRTRADYADGSFTTFTYDAVGRLTRATDSTSGAIDFFYDTLDRLILEVTPQGAVAYEYDAIGRRTKMTVAGQAPVTYSYDAASRLTQVAQGSLTVGIGYDAAGRRTSLTYPNGTSTSYTYDNASRLTRILHQGPGATTIEDVTYAYDAAGNRTALTRTNGIASLLPTALASASYDAANEQTQFAGAALTYDPNGNLTNDGTNTYVWDARNRLVGISGAVTAAFAYDALGRRTSKTISGTTTQFLYDSNDIVQEISGSAVAVNYVRSLNIDEAFGILRQDGTYFYLFDGLSSTLTLTNQAASPVVQYTFEPFGNTQSSNPAFANPFQFTGRENDGTGLYAYRARYYSSVNQRFLSQDPLSFPINYSLLSALGIISPCGGKVGQEAYAMALLGALGRNANEFHSYAYANNSPVVDNDPTGLGPVSHCINYDIDCSAGIKYACVARIACRAVAVVPGGMDCTRNCLLDNYFNSDKSAASQIIPHATCPVCCTSGRKPCGSAGPRGAGDLGFRG